MSETFPSDGWAQALKGALDGQSAFVNEARGWAPGTLALTVRGQDESEAVLLTLGETGCTGAKALASADACSEAGIVLEASREHWDGVLGGELDAVKALLGGEVKVTKGRLGEVVGHVFAYAALMAAASSVSANA